MLRVLDKVLERLQPTPTIAVQDVLERQVLCADSACPGRPPSAACRGSRSRLAGDGRRRRAAAAGWRVQHRLARRVWRRRVRGGEWRSSSSVQLMGQGGNASAGGWVAEEGRRGWAGGEAVRACPVVELGGAMSCPLGGSRVVVHLSSLDDGFRAGQGVWPGEEEEEQRRWRPETGARDEPPESRRLRSRVAGRRRVQERRRTSLARRPPHSSSLDARGDSKTGACMIREDTAVDKGDRMGETA